jgi:4-amino-4-deoxy-L-arabinose transferase-like glycosyltransferase
MLPDREETALPRDHRLTPAPSPKRFLAALIVVAAVAVSLASAGLGDESSTYTGGDPPRHLMNGVFLMDLVLDRAWTGTGSLLDYMRHYYARYPALSLGHHPVLLPVIEAATFGVFGISLTAARAIIIACFVAGALLTALLVRRTSGPAAGATAGLLFATNPHLVAYGRYVMTEMTGVMLVVAAAFFLERWCQRNTRRDLGAFVACAAASLYAKHLTVFVFPAYLAYALFRVGYRRLLRRDTLVAAGVLGLLIAPLVPITLKLSSTNVEFILEEVSGATGAMTSLDIIRAAVGPQMSWALLLSSLAGIARAVIYTDRRSALFAFWIASVMAATLLITRTMEPSRHTIYWLPAWLALAASIAGPGPRAAVRGVLSLALGALIVAQGWASATMPTHHTRGYEEAAQYVVQHWRGSSVLFSGVADTGLFAFFVRKHDPARRIIVLRSTKLFTTSLMYRVDAETRITDPSEILAALKRFGTVFLVVEDIDTGSTALDWVRDATRADAFVERFAVRMIATDQRLNGRFLRVYEFKGATPPDPDAALDLDLPIIDTRVKVRFGDLLPRQ